MDGSHQYRDVRSDVQHAAAATRRGGVLLLDDMARRHQTRKAFDDAVGAAKGRLRDVTCRENVRVAVSHLHRRDNATAKRFTVDWCTVVVA